MNAPGEGKSGPIIELQRDLAHKYRVHGPRVEELWRGFGKGLRTKAMKAGAADGVVLKDPKDRSMGDVYKMMPEYNLQDITEDGSDYLLDILKHRATKSIHEQYMGGANGGPGDHAFIINSMRVNNLRNVDEFKYGFTTFMEDGPSYGQSYRARDRAGYEDILNDMSVAVDAGLCVPQSVGELILDRQLYTLQFLNILVEDILEIGSTTRSTKLKSKKPEDAAREALSRLTISPKPEKLSLEHQLANALDQKSSLEEYLNLCRTEPVVLAHAVNLWFFTRPELVKDEKGRIMPMLTDKYVSSSVFELFHNAVAGVAIWDSICRLLQLLIEGSNDRVYNAIVLQELSNICHEEYRRVQKLLKRNVQTGSGTQYFKRISGVYDNGVARVNMKGQLELLTRENPQLHYLLRLCQVETDAIKAVTWIKKLDELHQAYHTERDAMEEKEWDAFADLAIITSFVQSLSSSLPMPAINNRKGQIFMSRLKETSAELEPLKGGIDLLDFAVPIDNLKEPGMLQGALNHLDQFVVKMTGTKMGFMYQDSVEESISETRSYCEQQKEKIGEAKKFELDAPPKVEAPSSSNPQYQQRRQKDKTRPEHSSVYGITPIIATSSPEIVDSPILKVKAATLEVFQNLFARTESRGSIAWTAFEAALADLKFSVLPQTGSVFKFFPPADMHVQKPLTMHRPHKSQIEGHKLLMFATQLKRKYGWDERSFELA